MAIEKKYSAIATLKESYDQGFQIGLTWDRDWRPGGPFVLRRDARKDPEWIALCKKSEANNKEFLRGFDDGIVERDKRIAA